MLGEGQPTMAVGVKGRGRTIGGASVPRMGLISFGRSASVPWFGRKRARERYGRAAAARECWSCCGISGCSYGTA